MQPKLFISVRANASSTPQTSAHIKTTYNLFQAKNRSVSFNRLYQHAHLMHAASPTCIQANSPFPITPQESGEGLKSYSQSKTSPKTAHPLHCANNQHSMEANPSRDKSTQNVQPAAPQLTSLQMGSTCWFANKTDLEEVEVTPPELRPRACSGSHPSVSHQSAPAPPGPPSLGSSLSAWFPQSSTCRLETQLPSAGSPRPKGSQTSAALLKPDRAHAAVASLPPSLPPLPSEQAESYSCHVIHVAHVHAATLTGVPWSVMREVTYRVRRCRLPQSPRRTARARRGRSWWWCSWREAEPCPRTRMSEQVLIGVNVAAAFESPAGSLRSLLCVEQLW